MRQQSLNDGFAKHRHQTRQGNPWYWGMKAHISVDSHSKWIHSVVATRQRA